VEQELKRILGRWLSGRAFAYDMPVHVV